MRTNAKLDIYDALFKSHLEYWLICWGGAKSSKLKPFLLILQKKVYSSHNLLKIEYLLTNNISSFMHRYYNSRCPTSFSNLLKTFRGENRSRKLCIRSINKKVFRTLPFLLFAQSLEFSSHWTKTGTFAQFIQSKHKTSTLIVEILIYYKNFLLWFNNQKVNTLLCI